MKFDFQRPDGSSVRVEAPSRDAALKYWKAQQAKPKSQPLQMPTDTMAAPEATYDAAPAAADMPSAPSMGDLTKFKAAPPANLLDAAGAALQNAPKRLEIGVQGMVIAGREALTETLSDLVARADEVAASPTRPPEFDTLADYVGGSAKPEDSKARAEELWQRFKNPATRDAVVHEIGLAQASSAAGAQLKIDNLNASMAKPNVRPGSMEDYLGQAVGAIAESSPGLVASVATKNPAPALMALGAQSFGTNYVAGRQQGLEAGDARSYAALQAAAEALPEMLPMHVFLKEGGALLYKLGGGAVTEGASEMLTAGVQALVDKGYVQPNMTWGEAWPKIRDAGIVGGLAGLGMGGVAAGTETAARAGGAAFNAAQQVSAEVLGRGVDLAQPIVQALTTKARDASQAAELARMLAGKSLDERIQIFVDEQQRMREPQAGEPPAEEPTAADLLRSFEGFAAKPYWDVTTNRAGYGSDTITNEDGTFRKVQPGDVVDEATAERDLERRLETEFIPTARTEVGVEKWDALPQRVQAALASVTYNYGNLPDSVARAARTGDVEEIAQAVEALAGHNDGVNEGRRLTEAAIIRGEKVDLAKGAALRGSPKKQLAAYLDMAGRALHKLEGALGEESYVRGLKQMNPTAKGAPASYPFQTKLAIRQERANNQAIDERRQLSFLLSRIRQLAAQTNAVAADVAPVTERLVDAIDAIALPTIAPAEAARKIAEQEPLQPDVEPAAPPTQAQAARGAGPEVESITPSGKRVTVRPEIVDIGTLQKASGAMQPRDRSRAASDAQIEEIAITLDPERLMSFTTTDRGAPIVGPDGMVESGNGRVAAIRRAAEAYPAKFKAYRDALEAAGYDLTGIETPVLIGRRTSQMTDEERRAFAIDSNPEDMSATEQAQSDDAIVQKIIGKIVPGESPTAPNSEFVRAFLGALGTSKARKYTDANGRINVEGQLRIQNALLAAAYGDPTTTARAAEDVDDNAKSITGALVDVAPEWLAMRQYIKDAGADPSYDLTEPLMRAINLLARARDKATAQKRPVKALINEAIDQIDTFTGSVDPMTVEMVKAFYTENYGRAKSRDDVTAFLRAITTEVRTAIEPSMLGDNPKPGDVIGGAVRKSSRETGKTGELFGAASPRGRVAPGGAKDGKRNVQPSGTRDKRSDAFKRWFGASKIVDSKGQPLVVYHGTTKNFDAFNARVATDHKVRGKGAMFFTTKPDVASSYAGSFNISTEAGTKTVAADGGNVLPVYLKLENPAIWDVYGGEFNADFVTKAIKEAKRDRHDGIIFRNMRDEPTYMGSGTPRSSHVIAVFEPTQIKSAIGNDGTFDADDPSILSSAAPRRPAGEPRNSDQLEQATHNLKFNPGPGYQPMLQALPAPARQTSVQVTSGNMKIPDKVTVRDEPRKKLINLIGPRLYQEKIKGKSRLGFYRLRNSEVRVKHYDDTEVMAHEAAHYLDFHHTFGKRFSLLRQQFAAEVNPLSYTQEPQLVNLEGFAEFVRLWATQYATAKRVAPNMTREFEAALRKARIFRRMTAFQEAAHRWYYQGDLAKFRGKSGESAVFADVFHAFMRERPAQLFLQGFVDPVYGAKVIERETTGTIASAEASPWKLYRMTRGSESMLEAAIEDGALELLPDGSYGTTGKGLKAILWPATRYGAKRLDQAMEYFKARRAQELMAQGRENLFSKDEIAAGLAYGQQFPEFVTMFDEYQGFNRQMLQFYQDMDLITPDQRAAFEKRNKAYVPFFRVVHQVEGGADARGSGQKIGKTLRGGERNTAEIATNIIDGLHANIQAALTARAKAALFATIQKSQEGSVFAVRIAPDSKRQKVAHDQMVRRIADVLVQLGKDVTLPSGITIGPGIDPNPVDVGDIDTLLATYPELMAFWQHNQTPTTVETAIESTIIDGELQHFEIQSKLLADMLVAPRAAPLLIRALRVPKRVLTWAVTSFAQFQLPNAIRDTTAMGVQSQSGARIGYETLRGFSSFLRNDPRFKAFRANGGLFAGRASSVQDANRKWAQLALPSRNGFDTVGKALAGWNKVIASVEQGSRIGEFSRGVDKSINPLEAAFRGRMISGDFAQMGRNEVWGWLLQITPFANAGLRGIETMVENLFTVDGRARVNAKSLGKFGLMTVARAGIYLTVATALLWWLNRDDERYKQLTVDEKARFWHVWTPDGQHHQIPKPYGVGFIFADLPEIALDYIKDRDGDAASKQMAYALAQHFWFLDYPGALQPTIEAMQNRKFTGAPIVPPNLQGLEGEDVIYQRTDSTPEFYRDLGKALKVSPLMAEHYAKGFMGYAEAYMVDAYEWLHWDREKWGEKPFARNVLSYFTQQFDGKEHPFRTKWSEGYYDLRARAASKAAAYRLLFAENLRNTSDFTTFTKSEVNLLLRSLATKFAKVDRKFADSDALLQLIKYDPKLSREEKEARINDFYDKRNAMLGQTYQEISAMVNKLERGIKQP